MTIRHDVVLHGVRPEPLAWYLKGIAILRIVAEQRDRGASAAWRDDRMVLRSTLDAQELESFLLTEWTPTPIICPWNGGSGFGATDNREGIGAISESTDPRFEAYRSAIAVGSDVVSANPEAEKRQLISLLRSRLPDEALRWLDATVVLGADKLAFPPLLGTGGNDGRLEFGNSQMRRLVSLLLTPKNVDEATTQLRAALYGGPSPRVKDVPMGQFAPGQAGGANTGLGYTRASLINPWDFVFALEGTVSFAASAVRAHDTIAGAAFPFFVRSAPGGFAAASATEGTRDEYWLPIWSSFATAAELQALIREGRAWLGSRPSESGTDFARAIDRLGVARGLAEFRRYVIAERNGLAYFATAAGRFPVGTTIIGDPLAAYEEWLERVRRAAQDDTAPARVSTAYRALQTTILSPAPASDRERSLFVALGRLSEAVITSRRHAALKYVTPPAVAPQGTWRRIATSDDPAVRLALCLGAAGIRSYLQPVTGGRWPQWGELPREAELGSSVPALERLVRAAKRRLLEPDTPFALEGPSTVPLSDVTALVTGKINDEAFGSLLESAMLASESVTIDQAERDSNPPLAISLCAAALWGPGDDDLWSTPTRMLDALLAGQGERAISLALAHLRAHDISVHLPPCYLSQPASRRLGAALLAPVGRAGRRQAWRAISTPTTPSLRGNS